MQRAEWWYRRAVELENVLEMVDLFLKERELRCDVKVAMAQNEIYWLRRKWAERDAKNREALAEGNPTVVNLGEHRPPE